MARQLLGVTVLGLVLAACSSAPIEPSSEQGSSESQAGSVSLPLTTQVGSVVYRLRLASFLITGEPLGTKSRLVKPLDDVTVHNEPLPIGSYSILLQKGWVLEKRDVSESTYKAVNAQLITPNPVTVLVDGKVPADALFGFVTTSGDVTLGDGSVNIRIGVQDCSAYDSLTATLGELTVQCLGTLNPKAYAVNKDGFLAPTFDKCTVEDKLSKIKQLLSLQYRSARLPYAKQCIAGRYDAFVQKFESSGVTTCPDWKLERVVNPINADVISKVIPGLPVIPEDGLPDDGRPLRVLEQLKVNSVYSVFLPQGTPGQKCQSPADCALACAGAFPGFALDTVGEGSVLTDPPAWLLDVTYPGTASDPYLRPGYYHPMSWYGGAPGVSFGDYNRYLPCGYNDKGVAICPPEFCSYYAGIHKQTRLQQDCLDKADIDTCVSYCGPPLP